MLVFVLKSTVILAAASIVAATLRNRSAAARHLVWMAAFTAILVLPLLAVSLPAIQTTWTSRLAIPQSLIFQTTAHGAAPSDAVAPARSASSPNPSPQRSIDWFTLVLALWAAGVFYLLVHMAVGYAEMSRRRRGAVPFDACCELPPGISVLESSTGAMPLAFGIFHPVIFLPVDAYDWSDGRRSVVLRHELAHIERGDLAMHIAARVALSLIWFHPLAWYAWREFLKEREKAADDLVLAAGARPSDYAGHLLDIARSLDSRPAAAWAAVAMARRSQLEGRLLSILEGRARQSAAPRASAVASIAAAVLLCAPIAAVRAQSPQATLPADVDATIRAAAAQKNYEILDNAASAFENQRNYDVARTLLDNSLQIRASVDGDQGASYAAGLVKLGALEASRRHNADALAFYGKAVSLGDRPETAPALIYLGIDAIGKKDQTSALGYLERAAAVSTASDTTGRAYMWMAVVEQMNSDHAAQAEEDYRQAIRTLDPNTSGGATALNLYARFLAKRGREAEAEPLAKQATAAIQKIESASRAAATDPKALRANAVSTKPALIRKVEPQYTEEARAAKLEGVVVVSIVIEPDGRADHIQVLKSLDLGLDEKAVEAVQQWQFRPGAKDGVPVPVIAVVEVNFRLL